MFSKQITFFILLPLLFFSVAITSDVLAQAPPPEPEPTFECTGSAVECARYNMSLTGVGMLDQQVVENTPFPVIIAKLLKGLLSFLGVVFLILVLYGGFTWMTAAGNDESVNKAKKIITQATIGLFVIIVSYAFVDFVFDSIVKALK